MDKTSIIVLVSLGVVVSAIVFFGVRSTTKTINNTLQEAKDQILSNKFNDRNDRKYDKVGILGGSRSKSKTKSQGRHPYLTTNNTILLFAGLFIGYILSHFL